MNNDTWENDNAYIHVSPYEVVVGDNPGGSGHTDNAGTCSPQEFMNGRFNDIVLDKFDETTLEEVLHVASMYIGEDAPALEPKDAKQLEAWKSIPIDEGLLELAENAHENGGENHGTGPNGSTELRLSDNVSLNLPQIGDEAVFLHTDGKVISRTIRSAPAIGSRGYAYIADIGLDIFDQDGELAFTTGDFDEGMTLTHGIGENYRITNILRNEDIIIAQYDNYFMTKVPEVLAVIGMRGYFRITPDRGIVSRVMKP